MRNLARAACLITFIFIGTGCIGSTTYHTATPIEKGELEIGIMPGVYGVTTDSGSIILPQVGFGLRTGVADNMDFGVRINGVTVTTDLNIALVNEPDFAFSIDPALTAFFFSVGEGSLLWIFAEVGLLVDVVKNDAMTFTLGLKPGFTYLSVGAESDNEEVSASGDGFTIGVTAGIKFKLTESLSLMPSVDVLAPVENFGDGFIFNAGVGILF